MLSDVRYGSRLNGTYIEVGGDLEPGDSAMDCLNQLQVLVERELHRYAPREFCEINHVDPTKTGSLTNRMSIKMQRARLEVDCLHGREQLISDLTLILTRGHELLKQLNKTA